MRRPDKTTVCIVAIILAILILPSAYLLVTEHLNTTVLSGVNITAKSGSYADIQTAVNSAAAAGGGNVHIPAGTFNFVPVGHWNDLTSEYGLVMVPAGVSIFGAPTTRFANGSVWRWGTVLVCSWDIPNSEVNPSWFFFEGDGDPDKPSRFSDIKLQGYGYLHPNSASFSPTGIVFDEVMNYRVDHCYFRDVTGGGVWAGCFAPNDGGNYSTHCNGVIDHCLFINTKGAPGGSDGNLAGATVGYGVTLGRVHNAYWDTNTFNVFGHYTNYTTVIEDCVFSKWRHCVCNSQGYSVIFRFNQIDSDFGFHSLDNHGTYDVVPGRSFEVYNCTFTNSLGGWGNIAIMMRGGSGLFYDNYADSTYTLFVVLSHDSLSIENDLTFTPNFNGTYIATCHDIYIWNNQFASPGSMIVVASDLGYTNANVDYFTHPPETTQDSYAPYPYPSPLTLGS